MEEKHEVDKIDDVMLPGFRFHPTDEELVGFYLKRKIQQRPLPIELIKQVDIYKYDPWDLPKFATTGEKEWYFYCPRDRKYRNSARPNRVTGAGFWKATGTDRPIYSADGTKCMGLKKSLVFYRGRAAKGIKTDWMMHEFRLPPLAEPSPPPKKLLDKSLPPNDAWAICRIFKKTNSMAQRALNHSWISHLQDTAVPTDILNHGSHCAQFSSENISRTTEIGSVFQICSNNELQQQPSSSSATFSALDISSFKPMNSTMDKPSIFPVSNGDVSNNWMFSPLNPALDFEGSQQQQFSGFCVSLGEDAQADHKNQTGIHHDNNQVEWGNIRSIGFPFSLPSNSPDAWDSPPCPSEISSTYSTNKCYT